jgi:DNA-directed RNA polymerase specialized sigma24 family protein
VVAQHEDAGSAWLAVIARSLAFLCLSEADLRDKDLAAQAQLLVALGIPRSDIASMLGTSQDTVRVTLARATKKKKRKVAARVQD